MAVTILGSGGTEPVGYRSLVSFVDDFNYSFSEGVTESSRSVSLGGTFTDNGAGIFTDSRGTTYGLRYSADYSGGFVDRSLVDKAYVDDTISTIEHHDINGLGDDDHNQYVLLTGRIGDVLNIDQIDEFTSGEGLTIDGTLIKDNLIYPVSTDNNVNIGTDLSGQIRIVTDGTNALQITDTDIHALRNFYLSTGTYVTG